MPARSHQEPSGSGIVAGMADSLIVGGEDGSPIAPHRGLAGATPVGGWAAQATHIQLPSGDLTDLFLFEEKRKVQQDRTVSLHGVVYEVDAALVGQTVTLRYDPARARRGVQVLAAGHPPTTAKPVQRHFSRTVLVGSMRESTARLSRSIANNRLGLTLETGTRPREVSVIDAVTMPTVN